MTFLPNHKPENYLFWGEIIFLLCYSPAPRVLNVQSAIEYIYPLVYPFRMCRKELDPEEIIQTQVYLLPSKVKRENVTKNATKPPPAAKKFPRRFQDGNNSPEEDWSDTSEDLDSDSSRD